MIKGIVQKAFNSSYKFSISCVESPIDAAQAEVIYVFCHHEMHIDMFDDFLRELHGTMGKYVVLISNDVRLPFKSKLPTSKIKAIAKQHTIVCLTNAFCELDNYKAIAYPFLEDTDVKCIYTPLHTLVLKQRPVGQTPIKHREHSCFLSMKFSDYDEHRKRILTNVAKSMRRFNLTYDQYGEIPGSVGIIDASITAKIMGMYALTPIVLEERYEYFGVMPNRLSEAVASGCLPIFVTDNVDLFRARADDNYSTTYSEIVGTPGLITNSFGDMAMTLLQNPLHVQDLVSKTLSIANIDLAKFEKQIGSIIEHKAYNLTTSIYEHE
jgi:hypothetical protein